jgi:iron complex outermembrane receptor protein
MNKKHFNRSLMTLSITAAMLTTVQAANAQEVEEVLVTGSFSASLQNALNAKRASTAAVDSIVADDIASFPDNNLAESLQRIPGVNIDRSGGEGKQISVRGLGADYTRVRVNGMETISTGNNNGGRAFDFNIFASELFNRIDVRKSQSARIDEGSLGATVDLSTGKPFDYDNNTIVLSGQGGWNTESETLDPRMSGLVSFKNDEETLGAAFSASFSERNVSQGGHNSGRFEANKGGTNSWANAADLPADVNGAVHPRFPRQLDREIETERLGLTGAIQWRPADRTLVTVDMLYADMEQTTQELTISPISMARTINSGRKETTVNDYYYDPATNALLYADLSGVDVRNESFLANWTTKFQQFSLTIDQEITDNLKGVLFVGQSKSDHKRGTEVTATLEKFNQDFMYDYRNNLNSPVIEFGYDPADINGYYVSELRDRPTATMNEFETARAELAYDFDVADVAFKLQGGVSYKEFTFDTVSYKRDSAIINQADHVNLQLSNGIANCGYALSDFEVTADMGSVHTGSTGQSWFLPNYKNIFDKYQFQSNSDCFPLTLDTGADRDVTEESFGQFVQLDFSTEISGIPVRGDVGVRNVKTDQTSHGWVGGTVQEVKRDYNDTLPSVNFVVEPLQDVLVRASWSEVMTRPSLGNLTPGGSASAINKTVSLGNPYLDPYRATATDFSVEWYFAENATLSVAYFEKDIESFPVSDVLYYTWGELKTRGYNDSIFGTFSVADDDTFEYKTNVNGNGGFLKGYEIQFQMPFTFGPLWMQDLGIKLNYTDIESELVGAKDAVTGKTTKTKMLGQSDVSYNGTLWYEKNDFSARVSLSYRDPFVTAMTTTAGPGSAWTESSRYIDAAMSYRVNDQVKLTVDMLNLSDEKEVTKMGDYGILDTSVNSGRQFYFGVQYTF